MQVQEGYSIEAQKERLISYCKSQDGWELVTIYVEEGESAKDMNRPELQRLLGDAQNRLFDVVLVYKLDRITRSVVDLYKLLETFEMYNVKFKSVSEIYDTTTATGKLFITLVAALAEFERSNLAERVRFGMEQLVREGKWHGGPVPYGFKWDGEQMHIVPEEAKVLQELRKFYMEGDGFGATSRKLNTLGYSRRGFAWSAQTVWYILDNPIYAGKMRYGTKKRNGKYATRKKEERVEVIWSDSGFPTIFTWEEYEEHTARMKKRQFYGFSKVREYWFAGVIRCARCGSTMIGRPYRNKKKDGTTTPGIINYICSGRSMQKGCNMPLLRQSLAEKQIMEYIKGIRISSEEIAAAAEQMEQEQTDFQSEIEALHKELRAVTERRKKWQYMFAEDLMSEKDFRERKREEDEKERIMSEQIEGLKAKDIGLNSDFMNIMFDLPEYWEVLDDLAKKETMQTIFENIIFECEVETGQELSKKRQGLPFYIKEVNFN